MKKKLTINNIAGSNLKKRRKQYIVMFIGIILAMIFSSSSIFFLYSMRDSAVELSKQKLGCQYAITSVENADKSVYEDMKNNELFTEYGIAYSVGFVYNEDKKLGSVVSRLDDDCIKMANISFIEGQYPAAENEIAVEKTALIKLGYENAKIGDTIKVNFMVQNDFNYLDKVIEKEYKLAGIASDKRQNIISACSESIAEYIPACFVSQNTSVELGGKERTLCYHSRPNIGSSAKEWANYDAKEYDYFSNHNYNYHKEIIGGYSTLILGAGTEISGDVNFMSILSIVLMLASCLAIINAFNSNLRERRKQIGMLRAIGATRRQIINIFGREAFIITLVTAPLSIGISYGLVVLAVKIIGDDIVVSKNIGALFLCVFVNIIIVMLSALIPLLKISKTSPIHAIRNVANNRKMKTKRIKSQKSFDMSSLLAKRYRMFYKSSNIIVCVILAITISLSCIFLGFAKGVIDAEFLGYGYDYSIRYTDELVFEHHYNSKAFENGFANSERSIIDSNPYVQETTGYKSCYAYIMVDEYDDYLNCIKGYYESYGGVYDYGYIIDWNIRNFAEKCLAEKSDSYYSDKSNFNINSDYVPINIFAFDNDAVEGLKIYDGDINIDKLNSGEEVILVAPKQVAWEINIRGNGPQNGYNAQLYFDERADEHKNDENIVLTGESTYKADDELDISVIDYFDPSGNIYEGDKTDFEKRDSKVKIGAIVSPQSDNGIAGFGSDFAIITTISGIENFSENEKYDRIEINCTEIDESINMEIFDMLQTISDKHNGSVDSSYRLKQEKLEQQRTLYLVIISLSILSFSVCAGIINNTIAAKIRENKREIGTLRAVGAGEREITISYIKQLLFVFSIGYGIGFGAYFIYMLAVYIDEIVINKHEYTLDFSPWLTVVFCIILFGICSLNLWLKIKKEMKNSIIDNIREIE